MANLREAFEYASQNPNSEFARNLKQMASSGSLDQEAQKFGIDLSGFKPKTTQNTDIIQTSKNVLGGIAEGVGGIGLTAIQKGGEALVDRFGTEQMKQNVANAPSLQEQLAETMGADRDSTGFGVGRFAGNIAATAVPVSKVGSVVGGVAQGVGAGKLASTVARGGAEGYLFDVGTKATEGEVDLTPGVGAMIGAGLPLAAPVFKGFGRLVQKAGEKTVGLATPTSSQEAQILQSYMAKKPFLSRVADVLAGTEKAPRTLAKTTAETTAGQTLPGIFGTKTGMGVQAKRASESLWKNVIEPKLNATNKAVDLDGFFGKIADDIVNSTDDLTRQKSLLEALDSVKEDYTGINSVSLPKLQKLKEDWAQFVPNKFYKGKDIGASVGQVRALMAKEARDTIYNTLGDDVRTAYLDYGNLLGLQELGQTAMTGTRLKGGAGSFIQELVSEAVTPVATIGGQILYRTGKGIEFIGKVGANTVGEAIGVGSSKKASDFASETISNTKLNRGMVDIDEIGKAVTPKKAINTLEQQAKKYKSAEEFVKAQQKVSDYGMSHRPTEGVRAFDLTEKVDGENMIPKDMYDRWYGSRGTIADKESIEVLKKIKGNPEADVTIYRASPKESFNNGDWVTFSKSYAKEHAQGNNTKVFSKIVKAKDVKWAMDDINEFGYYPESMSKSQLTDIWNKANKKYAESFGEVTKKTGSFYKIDNGNRVTDVYVEVPKKVVSLEQEAKKYKSVKEIKTNYPGTQLDVYDNNGEITLSKIIVPKEQRNSGIGSKIMKDLVKYADENGKKIVLTPSADYGGNKARLTEFYKRFGFVENKGKTKDFSTRETMYRLPK